ncbi:hypothetical protein TNCV_4114911 [Trichonephila clavipes]|nr:hypothetical protein TNCV_4114911 [Trichonephila clavipes]
MLLDIFSAMEGVSNSSPNQYLLVGLSQKYQQAILGRWSGLLDDTCLPSFSVSLAFTCLLGPLERRKLSNASSLSANISGEQSSPRYPDNVLTLWRTSHFHLIGNH